MVFWGHAGVSTEIELDSSTLSSAPSRHSHKGPGSRLKPGYQTPGKGATGT